MRRCSERRIRSHWFSSAGPGGRSRDRLAAWPDRSRTRDSRAPTERRRRPPPGARRQRRTRHGSRSGISRPSAWIRSAWSAASSRGRRSAPRAELGGERRGALAGGGRQHQLARRTRVRELPEDLGDQRRRLLGDPAHRQVVDVGQRGPLDHLDEPFLGEALPRPATGRSRQPVIVPARCAKGSPSDRPDWIGWTPL